MNPIPTYDSKNTSLVDEAAIEPFNAYFIVLEKQ